MGKGNMGQDKIKKEERDAAISLLITVFEMHDKEVVLNKALDDFLCCYGEEIPEWLQCLYGHFVGRDNNGIQMQVIKQFAENHNLEIRDGFE